MLARIYGLKTWLALCADSQQTSFSLIHFKVSKSTSGLFYLHGKCLFLLKIRMKQEVTVESYVFIVDKFQKMTGILSWHENTLLYTLFINKQ